MEDQLQWEVVKTKTGPGLMETLDLRRLAVPEGWLILSAGNMLFMPDGKHAWLGDPGDIEDLTGRTE